MSNVPQKFWGKTVTLKNKFTQEYLFAHESKYNSERRYILTMRNKCKVPGKGDWILDTKDGKIFTLKNKFFSEYLYAAGSNLYRTKGMFGYDIDPKCNITVKPQYPVPIPIPIPSVDIQRQKSPADRFVFSWAHKNEQVTQGDWFIEQVPWEANIFRLKNCMHNEYLMNVNDEYDWNAHYVYTSGQGFVAANYPTCHWEMEIA